MKNRDIKAVKKRISDRRKQIIRSHESERKPEPIEIEMDGGNEEDVISIQTTTENVEKNAPSPKPIYSEWLPLRIMIATILVLLVSVLYRSSNPTLDPFKSYLSKSLNKDYPFAKVSKWASDSFGDMFSFSPFSLFEEKDKKMSEQSIPVIGRVKESFKRNGQGVTVETEKNRKVTAVQDGVVVFAGIDKTHGKTVIVQQANDMNVWYGGLESIEVNLYQHITSGDAIGMVTNNPSSHYGEFYLAIEKDNEFLNPVKVISFE